MYKHSEITGKIIQCAQRVHGALGFGFLERVYHNAMVLELAKAGFEIESEKKIPVYYGEHIVGDYVADIVVAGRVILEIKAVQELHSAHETQLVNYLKATDIDIGLLLNFGKSLEVKRKIFDMRG